MTNARSMQTRLSFRLVCSVLLVCFFLVGSARTQPSFTSYDVEAAYLYNFGKFVRWPADTAATAPFSICILGDDPFGTRLTTLIANETIQGRPVLARHIATVTAAAACQILFLGSSEEPRLAKDLADLQKKPVLTVSNLPDFLERGGIIQFLQVNNKVRFAVNHTAAEPAGLSLSSELLKVAVSIETKDANTSTGGKL